ncbi:hypothetical protein P691DRAFT_764564 [Macrolepiota fuliginosa MF-IS2]|uniref:DUF6593 domain-containing protein n=1 Tax=Macrolepiota fuliginosa MF-IS2 TaxID=1400762 RepID=A0A9P5X5D5_9AGAR|nr:hypothetical protein P691DRAFT_764564 [Macrolepiota fuliginosa MF-IS2]
MKGAARSNMILNFSERSVSAAVLLTNTGLPVYQVSTSTFGFKTKISKMDHSTQNTVTMGVIDRQVLHTKTTLWGKDIELKGENYFSASRTFVASDNRRYKWKVSTVPLTLVTAERGEREMVAIFDSGSFSIFSKSRPMSLNVADKYMHILDDIVMTCILIEQKSRKNSSNAGAAGGASAAGGSSC